MLEVKNLHARIGEKEILKGIDLVINDGETHAIMGPNGSGKSTLSAVLVGNPLYEVTEGEAYFNGKNLLEMKPEDRAHEGLFLSFQYPVEIPGVSMTNFMKAAIVEIIVKDRAEVKYSTVQNWYPGDENGKGGVLNLVTKRGDLRGVDSKLSWTQVETGSAITWKYPSCILRGDNSQAEFYSVAVTNNYQEADTGTKMIHIGKNTKSTIISKGISAGHSQNSYRGLVRAAATADNARNYSSCDSLLLGSDCGAHTFPYMDVHNDTAIFEHEATTSKISEDQLFYCNQRGIPTEQAVGLIVNGYAKEVLQKLPMEFAVEAQKLLSVSLEGTVG